LARAITLIRNADEKSLKTVQDFPGGAPMTAAHYADASAAYGRLPAPFHSFA